jgi:ABC-2 type transport system permease protein
MFNLIMADFFKIRRSAAIKVLLAITVACSVAMVVMSWLINGGNLNSNISSMVFLFSDMNVTSILGAVIAGVYICGDFDNKTIHDAIASGSSRGEIIISKAISFFCTIAFILLPYAIVAGIAIATGSKFGANSAAMGFFNLIIAEAGKTITAIEVWKLIAIMITTIIVYMAELSICVPLALLIKKPVLVVAINYGFSILCGQLMSLSNNSEPLHDILAFTPFGGNYILLSLKSANEDIIKAIAVSIVFILAMCVITFSAFRKSDVK